jgi:hypothetical protein
MPKGREASILRVTGRIVGANIGFMNGKPQLTLEVNELNDFRQLVDDLNGCEKLSIEVKPFRARRSLDANAYFFVLADKLAEKLNTTKVEIYRNCIKEIGGVSETVCVKDEAVDKLCEAWQEKGLGWQADTFPSKINGCTNVILYYGSSTYDTAQMSRLIENIVQECKEQGIETATPDEIAKLVSLWESR